jgi:hypothetical protein
MSSTGRIVEHPVVTGLRTAAGALDPDAVGLGWQLGDDEVETALATVLDLRSRTAAVEAMLLREAETRDLKARTKALTVVRWLGDRFRLSRADAAARTRAAEALGRHPVVQCALAAGAVTAEQGEVLTRVLDTVAAMPGVHGEERAAAARFLVAQCEVLKPVDLARAGQAVVEALTVTPSEDDPADADALAREQARAEAEAQRAERNFLTVTARRGKVRAILELGSIGDAVLQQWLHTTADARHAGAEGFEDSRPLSERRGDALVDLLAQAAGTPTPRTTKLADHNEPEHAEQGEVDVDEFADEIDVLNDDEFDDEVEELDDDEFDALDGDVDTGGRESASGQGRLPGLERDGCRSCGRRGTAPPTAVLTVTTTVDGLRGGLAGAGRLDTGLALSAAALRMLACDGLIVPAVLGQPSEVLDLGRGQRDFNRAQRRAAALRDRGCVAPGCDQPPSACHVHHMWWWIDGGPTDLANAALLCGFHHRMVHRQGWRMTLAPNRYPQLIPPTSIDPGQRPRQHHRFLIPDHQDTTLRTGRQRT